MLIKLNLEGELLESVLEDAKRNCRTNPQQIIYYLKQIYEGNIVVLNGTDIGQSGTITSRKGTNEVLTSEKTYCESTNIRLVSTDKVQNDSNIVSESDNKIPQSTEDVPKEVLELDNDIFDF